MDLAPDFDEFIGSLIAQRAEFLVVDAYALRSTARHGSPGTSTSSCGRRWKTRNVCWPQFVRSAFRLWNWMRRP
jgi:hypothetical protein